MSNVPSTNVMTNVPAHIAARIAARQQAGTKSAITAAIVGGDAYPRISIKAGRYRLVEGGVETVVGITLDTVIVAANPRVSKVFYAKAYDSSSDNVRPDCFSNDGIMPDASVTAPVANGCANCPNNVLGSKINPGGAKSKLCSDQRHLAVVAAADPNKVYSLTIPVSAMKPMREYFKELDNYGIVPEEVVTQLGFDDTASYPKITFKQTGYVPEKFAATVDALTTSDEARIATREKSGPTPTALAAPASQQALTSAPAPAPAPVAPPAPPAVDEAYEEEAAPGGGTAPVVAAPAPAARPAVAPVAASSELAAKLDSLFG